VVPFGAIIVRDDEVIATGVNRVTDRCDPTAHAEVCAIREASAKLKRFDLSDCEIYTSCEPCPMCLGAIYWAHLKKVYYAGTKQDAADAGFDDSFIYEELSRPYSQRHLPMENALNREAKEAFKAWGEKKDKIEY